MTSIITVDELGFCINKTGPAIESLDRSELSNICILASNYLKEIATANQNLSSVNILPAENNIDKITSSKKLENLLKEQ